MAMIMLAVYSPKLDVQFISTTHGNQTVDKTYNNARRTLTWIKRADRIPVYRGYPRPLIRDSVACPEIHGESGLAGVDWSEIDALMPRNPALDLLGYETESELCPTDFFGHLHRLVESSEGRFDLIVTGAQTNIAQYLSAFPGDGPKLRVHTMAGNFGVIGNIGAFSEFNVLIDPEAAKQVLNSGCEYYFAAPLDITHTVLVTPAVLQSIRSATEGSSREFADRLTSLLLFFVDTYSTVFGFESPPLHDPVAAFHAISPESFESIRRHVDIETVGQFTAGACCADIRRLDERAEGDAAANATICLRLREGGLEGFWSVMIDVWARIASEIGASERSSATG
jgi:inosine-uridine nucleoside N-ribohydrolase